MADYEQLSIFEGSEENKDKLKEAVDETLAKVSRRFIVAGAKVMCNTILGKIEAFEKAPGSKSNNDHKRLIKDIKHFCETCVSSNEEEDAAIDVDTSETAQN